MIRQTRSSRFATPFVIVVGCGGGPRTEPARPHNPIATAAEMDALPDRVSVPVDAAVADAAAPDARTTPLDRRNPNDRPVYFDPCGGPPDPNKLRCNPPRPVAVQAKIIAIRIEGGDTIITAAHGNNHGVTKVWRAELVAGNGRALAYRLQLVRVTKQTTELRLRGGIEDARSDMQVRLSPP
ncbi:MAG: hypothetical protein H0T46_34630 [Deltaproteobacteria bacterium]|nr:hypothetical protein [Deltaproteobacteria bacterium]